MTKIVKMHEVPNVSYIDASLSFSPHSLQSRLNFGRRVPSIILGKS